MSALKDLAQAILDGRVVMRLERSDEWRIVVLPPKPKVVEWERRSVEGEGRGL